MSDAPEPPPGLPRRDPHIDPAAGLSGWKPPRSGAYRSDSVESVRIISGDQQQSHRGGNGAELTDEHDEPEERGAGEEPATVDGSGSDGDERRPGSPAGRAVRAAIEWAAVIGGALVVAFVVKTFLVQAFWIPSPSMADTLVKGDRVLVNKLADDVGDIHRGDVIVFKRPEDGAADSQEGQIEDLIKRVVGLPGDVLESRDGALYVNDRRLDEPYLAPDMRTDMDESVTVPDGHVFVMGDNRTNSHDSRVFGAVPGNKIVGRAFLRVWPLSHLGQL